jgi:hypothetical protein
MGQENSYQIAIKSLFWPKCWIASYNTQEATYLALQPVFGLGLITKVTPFLSILR